MLSAYLVASLSLAPLADVRVGEQGHHVRIEILCSKSCAAEPFDEGAFLVTWASGDFEADVTGKSRYVQKIRLNTQKFGTAFAVETEKTPRSVIVKSCGPARICFDYDFSVPNGTRMAPPTVEMLEHDLTSLMVRTGYIEKHVSPVRTASLQAPIQPPVQAIKASFAPPPQITAPVPAPREPKETGVCAEARAALKADAWNMGAYRTVELCDQRAAKRQEAAASSSSPLSVPVAGTALR